MNHEGDENLYGLDEEGNLYYWGYKNNPKWSIEKQKEDDGTIIKHRFYGWIKHEDELWRCA